MAWEGFFTYAGSEIINAARTEAYAQNAELYWFHPIYENNSIPLLLGDGMRYSNPMQDDAPWTDPDIPESYEFYGAYPLEVAGIEDSTRSSEVIESTKDGGIPGRLRHGTKSIVFNVVLVAGSEAAANYGFQWLKQALLGSPCGDNPSTPCNGAELCYLSSEPYMEVTAADVTPWSSQVLATNLYPDPFHVSTNVPASLATNLAPNPAAENAAGWLSNNAAFWVPTRDTSIFHSGTQSVRTELAAGQVSTNVLSLYSCGGLNVQLACGSSATISAGMWMRAGQAGYKGAVSFLFYTAADAFLSQSTKTYVNLTSGVWTFVKTEGIVSPATTAKCYIVADVAAQTGNATPGHFAHVDDCVFHATGSCPPYFDGNSVSTSGDYTFSWTGTAHASTSLWKAVDRASNLSPGAVAATYSADWNASGTGQSLRLQSLWKANGSAYIDLGATVSYGKTYTLTGKCRIRATLPTAPTAAAFTVTGSQTNHGVWTCPSTAPGVYDVSMTWTYPATADNKYLRIYNNNALNDQILDDLDRSVFYDDMMIVEGATAYPVFSGDTPDGNDVGYSWTATPANGPSAMHNLYVEPTGDDAEACLSDYLRTLRKVLVNKGPTVTAKRSISEGGAVWTAQFTAVAGSPFEFGAEIPVMEGFGDPAVEIPWAGGVPPDGAYLDLEGDVVQEVDCAPKVYLPLYDPRNPAVIPPPSAPNVPLGTYTAPANWHRRSFTIPKQMIPLWGEVVPKMTVHAPSVEIRNLRLRFYADPFEIGSTLDDPCAYCGDIVISYVPANHTLVFDAASETVTVLSPGGVIRRADSLVFKTDGGPFDWPRLSCGFGYIVTLDLPQNENVPVVDLSLIPRVV